ncbi:phage head morphogenesis protein [Pelagerythrobacter marinus]|nr:phage head morphogenesis protein [Pelagerythrobacter marinus]
MNELDALIETLEPRLRDAFRRAILVLRDGIDTEALIEALRDRNIDAAIAALNVEPGAFSGYAIERQVAFAEAGAVASQQLTKSRAKALPKRDATDPALRSPVLTPPPDAPAPPTLTAPGGGRIEFRFDMTNPRAEQKIRSEAAARVAGYVEEQIETARRVIADGFARGEGPQNIATDIAGRINPISRRREGGIIGLSDPQAGYVESMRARLLSGDPEEMMKVLGRFGEDGKWIEGTGLTLRDRRFDAQIKRAIRDVAAGKRNPLTRAKVDEMTARYSDRLLARRAEDIARTETAQGVMLARAEATRQALGRDNLDDAAVTKTWLHSGGIRHARDTHLAMHGKAVIGLSTPFLLPDGSVMQHSHDPDGGVTNNANCRCNTDFAIDWAYGL